MSMQFDALGLSRSALPLLRDLVHDRLGLYYESTRLDVFADRLSSLLVQRGFDSFLEYYYLLKYDEAAATEWPRVMDALSIGETYFWREIDQLRAVVDHLVPWLFSLAPFTPIRIWCVPCATGEEPLTIAMLLEERGWFERAAIEIHASDASPAMIARARAGRYRPRAFRSLPVDLQDKYFTREGDEWIVDRFLQRRVTSWSVANLMCEGDVASRARVPIVVCRNVFIYFSAANIERVANQFAAAMPAPGYLCLGAAESLLKLRTPFELQEIGGAFVYVKPDSSDTRTADA